MSKPFTVVHAESGEVLCTGTTDDLSQQERPGVIVLGGIAPPNSYYNGSAWEKLPPRPSRLHAWDRDEGLWKDPRSAEDKWAAVRAKRTALLRDSDWVVTRASEEGGPVPKEWRDYRKALRDITTQPDPDNLTWPVAPT